MDATEGGQSLAQKFGVQGFPTLKIFGADKKKPTDYNGQRTSDAIVSECMRAANQLVKDRKKGKTASSGGGAKSGGGGAKSGGSKPAGGSGSGGGGSKGSSGGSAVVELTELNFNALVLESNDHWLVEFYAPWYVFHVRLTRSYCCAPRALLHTCTRFGIPPQPHPACVLLFLVVGAVGGSIAGAATARTWRPSGSKRPSN